MLSTFLDFEIIKHGHLGQKVREKIFKTTHSN